MRYFLDSIRTWSYWRYAIFSLAGVARVFIVFSAIYLFVEALDFFQVYKRDSYSAYALPIFGLVACIIAIATRRPVSMISYRIGGRDLTLLVRIGDLFATDGDVVISS